MGVCRYVEAREAHPVETPQFHYVIVRGDLPRGIQAANIVHAAGESVPHRMSDGTHAVVLTVPDEPSLVAARERLVLACVPHKPIFETDPPYSGQLMAIGVEPGRKEDLRRHLSSLPLLK